jgi:hypothetical protein
MSEPKSHRYLFPPRGAGEKPAPQPAPARTKPAAAAPPAAHASAGRIAHDDRGNAVWDWMKQAGRSALDSTSRLLEKLDIGDLRIEEPDGRAARGSDQSAVDAGGGYNPYEKPSLPKPGRR